MTVESFFVFACSVCLSPDKGDSANLALRASLFCLLGVTAVVLAFFAKFFWRVLRREKLL